MSKWPAGAVCLILTLLSAAAEKPRIELRQDDDAGQLHVSIDRREVLVYQYSPDLDIPHYYPLNGPSGRNMLVQKTEPYPHHRAFWFADTVRLNGGREVSLYNALYSGQKTGENSYGPPYRDRIKHKAFTRIETGEALAVIEAELVWHMDGDRPILGERRLLIIRPLGEGEYFLDLTFTLRSDFGVVEFASDEVHYAWPYLRLQTHFSGENGGIITSDSGASGERATNMKPARWMDYSNSVDGIREGIAIFQWPDGREHRWLTREYGTFGPRRPDDLSGKPFSLQEGESMSQRVGILVHKGDCGTGRVAERYRQYVEVKLK